MRTVFNPVEAERFAAWLEEESGRVMLDLRDTVKVLTNLQNSWNDPKYNEYLRTFDASAESLARFKEHADKYVSFLRNTAAFVAEYLG
jgi:hypothetical protein